MNIHSSQLNNSKFIIRDRSINTVELQGVFDDFEILKGILNNFGGDIKIFHSKRPFLLSLLPTD